MSSDELIDIIDLQNNVVGCESRAVVYSKGLSHRVVHVMVVHGSRVFIPRRALDLRYCPGHFCSSAGGHVSSGESVEEAALRELVEEIGLHGPISKVDDFFFIHDFPVHVSLFVKEFRPGVDLISLNPREVDSGRFYEIREISVLDHKLFHPQLATCLEKLNLLFYRKGVSR